jgi:hypothetical protein
VSIHVFTDEMSTTLLHHVLGLDSAQTPASLERFVATHNIPQSDVDMLASIRFSGRPTADRRAVGASTTPSRPARAWILHGGGAE